MVFSEKENECDELVIKNAKNLVFFNEEDRKRKRLVQVKTSSKSLHIGKEYEKNLFWI